MGFILRMIENFYEMDCQLFRNINKHFDHRGLNTFLQSVTHAGGAMFTISTTLLLLFFSSNAIQLTAFISAISLSVSHLPVAIIKKLYPRRRPYLVLDQSNVSANPLQDHSFPSGHTTAIFSIITPFILYSSLFAFFLLPLGLIVGFSRIYLGLHYPSDVIAGSILGSSTAIFSFLLIQSLFPPIY